MKRTIAAILVTIGVALAHAETEQVANVNFGQLPKNYQTMMRGYFSLRLRDPYSAVYRFGTPRKAMTQDGIFVGHKRHYGWVVPVWVNAKNGFGGYVGEQLYYVMYTSTDDTYGDVTEMFNLGRGKFVP